MRILLSIAPENVNFPKFEKLKGLSSRVGYSGHLNNIDDALLAICLGATFIEKHFTIDKTLPEGIIKMLFCQMN